MSAVVHAHRAISAGDGDLFIAGGVENMTRGPWVISKVSKPFGRDSQMHDSSFGWRFINPKMKDMYGVDSMGNTAENLASKYNISREDQDKFAYNSQMKASSARKKGRFINEIVSVEIPQRKKEPIIFSEDEFIKDKTSIEILSKLRTAFKSENGTVTAGNSSGLNDGSAAMLLASEQGVKENNLSPIARIVSSAIVGVEPSIMGIGPVLASNKALEKANLKMHDMDIIELNEAFASQSLACIKDLEIDIKKVNLDGGAISLGHPLGATGARITGKAAELLVRENKKYALATQCIGFGMGIATIIETVN